MLKKRKGQVTLFIILGIVLLVIAAVFFIINRTLVESQVNEAQNIIENVPFEFSPIKSYTENCLKAAGEQGLVLLGQHGGYIKPEEWHGMSFSQTDQTDSDGIVFPNSKSGIPYWLYNSELNSASAVRLASHQPAVMQMEKDLIRWLEQEIPACIDSYKAFEGQGFSITEKGPMDAAATIVSGHVRFSLDYPIDASKGSSKASMKHFYTEVPVDLLRLYQVAYGISSTEQNTSFLERNTLNLMTLFSSSTPGKLMPMTDTTFDTAGNAFWSKSQLKEDTKLILTNYIPLLRYYQSGNFFSYRYPEDTTYSGTQQRIYNDMVLPLTGADGLDVRFDYLSFWEPYFEMNCEGDICRPQSISIDLFGYPFSMQRYKAVYDISYPVLVSLRDPAAFDSKGYTFSLAFEANIRNNRPAFDGIMLPPASDFQESLLCDDNQRNSGNITITVRDAHSAEPIRNTQIAFAVGEQSCVIGATDNGGALISQFPIALGGVVHAVAPDYVGRIAALDTGLDRQGLVNFELDKYVELDVSAAKKKLVKCMRSFSGGVLQSGLSPNLVCYGGGLDLTERNPLYLTDGRATNIKPGWHFVQEPFELSENEEAIVSLTRVSQYDDPVTFAAHVTGSESVPMRIPPGKYKLSIQLIDKRELVIPAREVCGDDDGCETIPEVRIPQWISGGLEFDGEEGGELLDIGSGGLNAAERMLFYAVSPSIYDIPTSMRIHDDMNQADKVKAYSKTYSAQLQPRYS